MIQRMLKFSRVAALSVFGLGGLALGTTPAAAGGCGYGCGGYVTPVMPVVYSSCGGCCGGCGGAYAYAPAYGYYTYGYGAAYAPYAYVNRFYRPRVYVGPRVWVR
jgi:hypothetical protein